MAHNLVDEFKAPLENNDIAAVSNLLIQHGSLAKRIDEDLFSCNKPLLAACRSTEMVEVLLNQGANIEMEHTPPKNQLLVACMMADRPSAESIASEHPNLLDEMDNEDRSLLAKLCWETNQNIAAIRLMLDLGFPVDVPEHNHGYSPLHNAAWCGNAELVELLIERGHPVDVKDPEYNGTPIGWARYSCHEAKRHPEGEFPRVVDLLLQAGAFYDMKNYPTGHDGIDAVLKRRLAIKECRLNNFPICVGLSFPRSLSGNPFYAVWMPD